MIMDLINKSKWQIRLAVIIIFALGFIAGALTLNLYYANRSGSFSRSGRHRLDRVIEQLNLNQEQREQIDKVLKDARSEFRAIYKESEPKISEIRKQVRDRIEAVLTPEQQEQFKKIMDERERSHRKRRQDEDLKDR